MPAAARQLSVALLLLETLPLVFRRKWPIPVLAVTLGATVLHASLADTATVNESIGVLVALFTVADRYERRVSIVAAFAVAASFAIVFIAQAGIPDCAGRDDPDAADVRRGLGAR